VSAPTVAPVLDRGRAWLDMVLCTLAMFTAFATAYSFGTFVKPMAAEFDAGRGATALVFGITACGYFMLGAVTGPLVRRVGPRAMVAVGGTIQVVGILITARVNSLWQAYLSYGIGVGIGVACCYIPMIAVVSGWFERKRTTAIGISVSGIGIASLIGPPLAARFIKIWGWRDAYTAFAIGTAVLLGLVAIGVRPPPSFGAASTFKLTEAIRTRSFKLIYMSTMLASLALFSVFVNLVPYAEDQGIRKVTAATLLSIVGGGSILGRNALAASARRFGAARVLGASTFLMGATQLLWLFAGNRYLVLAGFAAIFGVAYGGFIALAPILLAETFGPEQLGSLAGVSYTASGVAALFGPTVGAGLVDWTGSYQTTIILDIVLGLGSAAMIALLIRHTQATH
jgi:MFS family permease